MTQLFLHLFRIRNILYRKAKLILQYKEASYDSLSQMTGEQYNIELDTSNKCHQYHIWNIYYNAQHAQINTQLQCSTASQHQYSAVTRSQLRCLRLAVT